MRVFRHMFLFSDVLVFGRARFDTCFYFAASFRFAERNSIRDSVWPSMTRYVILFGHELGRTACHTTGHARGGRSSYKRAGAGYGEC